MSEGKEWTGSLVDPLVIAAAKHKVERASAGDYAAGLNIIGECVLALKDIVQKGSLPDAERQLYLTALHESLEKIVEGVEPSRAMRLDKPNGRPVDPQKLSRDLNVFMLVGQEYERLTARGHTQNDKPIAYALKLASSRFGLTLAATQKIWSDYGSLVGWRRFNSD